MTAPVDHPEFAIEPILKSPDGQEFLGFLDQLFDQFESWF